MYQAEGRLARTNFQFYAVARQRETRWNGSLLGAKSSARAGCARNFTFFTRRKRDIVKRRGITGMEALLRWQHPDLGVVAPEQFLAWRGQWLDRADRPAGC